MTMKAKVFLLIWAIVLCLLTACSGFNQADALDGSAWVLSALGEKPALKGSQVTIRFGEGRVSGSSGCNSYSGSYQVKGNKFSTSQMAMTLMACADAGMMEQEQEFLAYPAGCKLL